MGACGAIPCLRARGHPVPTGSCGPNTEPRRILASELAGSDGVRCRDSGSLVGTGWRRGRDSNPRDAVNVYAISSRAPSTTRTPLREGLNLGTIGAGGPRSHGASHHLPGWDGAFGAIPLPAGSGHPFRRGPADPAIRRAEFSASELASTRPAGSSRLRRSRRNGDGGGGGIRTHDTLLTYTGFRDRRLQPLGHPSRKEGAESRIRLVGFQPLVGRSERPRRSRKNDRRSSPHSSARMPRTISTR